MNTSSDSPQGVKATERPLYYAKHGMVWKRPVEKKHEDGSTTVSLGFPVCKLHEACEGQEEQIAEMLCRAESHDALVKALEEAKAEGERTARNRDMWKGQVERQAEQLTSMRAALEKVTQISRKTHNGWTATHDAICECGEIARAALSTSGAE